MLLWGCLPSGATLEEPAAFSSELHLIETLKNSVWTPTEQHVLSVVGLPPRMTTEMTLGQSCASSMKKAMSGNGRILIGK